MSNTLTMALDLATAHRFDRIQYELGPLPWEQHIEDSGADLDPISEDYEPVSAWVALGPVESALYDGPCWLWARGLDIDHDAQRRREREAKATASRERTEAVAYLVANALEAHRGEIEPIEPSDRRFRETRAAVLRAQDTGASVGTWWSADSMRRSCGCSAACSRGARSRWRRTSTRSRDSS